MLPRRRLLINKSYQFPRAVQAAAAVLIVTASAAAYTVWTSVSDNLTLKQVEEEQQAYHDIQQELYKTLLHISANPDSELRTSEEKLRLEMEHYSKMVKTTAEKISGLRGSTVWSVLIIAALALLSGIALILLVLKQTSGISGQMLLLEKYFDDILEGKRVSVKKLRINDSFQDVFKKLDQVMRKLGISD